MASGLWDHTFGWEGMAVVFDLFNLFALLGLFDSIDSFLIVSILNWEKKEEWSQQRLASWGLNIDMSLTKAVFDQHFHNSGNKMRS